MILLRYTCVGLLLVCGSSANAVMPPGPANTNGDGNPDHNVMKHALVSQMGSALSVHIADPPPTPVTMTSGLGTDYTPAKFNVLEDVWFNAQYGWLPDGFFDLPADASIWIERTGVSQPSGARLRVYEGGNMTQGMGTWTMDEIHTHDGYRWQWDGLMQHDYYTADAPGEYAMSFRVYAGDMQGVPLTGFVPADTVFRFQAVPEPAASGYLLLAAAACWLRRAGVNGCVN